MNPSGSFIGSAVYLEYQVGSTDSKAILPFILKMITNNNMNRTATASISHRCFICICSGLFEVSHCRILHLFAWMAGDEQIRGWCVNFASHGEAQAGRLFLGEIICEMSLA